MPFLSPVGKGNPGSDQRGIIIYGSNAGVTRILYHSVSMFLPDDGLIQQSDLRLVMKACMEENGMKFDEKEIEDLVSRYNRITESCLT